MADNRKLAQDILGAIGGKGNVSNVTHCMTRLRLNLKDESIPNENTIKKLSGVLGVVKQGGQMQIVIGQSVDKVYACICELGGFEAGDKRSDNAAKPGAKKKLTPKSIGMGILDGLSGCLTPVIPVILAASIFKMIVAVLGPDMLGIMSADGDLYQLFTMAGDAGYYFFPLLIGYTAAKKFGATPVLGIFLGAIMLHPAMVQMASEGTVFTVFGIPCNVQNYSSTLLPIIMSVYVMSHIEKFLKRHIPDSLKILFVPLITITIMLPISLCILGPSGAFFGTYICRIIIAFSNTFGFIGAAVIGASWEFLVMSGMHHVMITQMIMVFAETGSDPVITLGAVSASMSVSGMCLGMVFASKNNEDRSLSISYVIAGILGGVTEPGLYGIGMKYKKPFIGMMAGGFFGALYAGIVGVKAFALVPVASFLALTAYAGGSVGNLVHGVISGVIAFAAAALTTYILCKEKIEDGESKGVIS